MEYDPKWSMIAKSPTDPLALFNLIEKTILAHSELTYGCTHSVDHSLSLLNFRQNQLSLLDYKRQFESKVKVARALDVLCVTARVYNNTAQLKYSKTFRELTEDERDIVYPIAEEMFLAYLFIRNSGPACQVPTGSRRSIYSGYQQLSKDATVGPFASG